MVTKRLCNVPGCNRLVKSQGICQRHGAKTKKCCITDCPKQAQGGLRGLCKAHYKITIGDKKVRKTTSELTQEDEITSVDMIYQSLQDEQDFPFRTPRRSQNIDRMTQYAQNATQYQTNQQRRQGLYSRQQSTTQNQALFEDFETTHPFQQRSCSRIEAVSEPSDDGVDNTSDSLLCRELLSRCTEFSGQTHQSTRSDQSIPSNHVQCNTVSDGGASELSILAIVFGNDFFADIDDVDLDLDHFSW